MPRSPLIQAVSQTVVLDSVESQLSKGCSSSAYGAFPGMATLRRDSLGVPGRSMHTNPQSGRPYKGKVETEGGYRFDLSGMLTSILLRLTMVGMPASPAKVIALSYRQKGHEPHAENRIRA